MATYISLMKWTDKGRAEASTLPDRAEAVEKQLADWGIQLVGHWTTMGAYDQIAVFDAPNEDVIGKAMALIAGRGYVVTETLRGWTMDEVRKMS